MIKVLIVEDDPMVAELNSRYVAKLEGFSLQGVAFNCGQALDMLAEGSYDLVLVDIFLPDMDGLKMLAKIREIGHGVDVIMVTAARDTDSFKKALRLGAVDYLVKPFTFERLRFALNQYKARFTALRERTEVSQREIDAQLVEKALGTNLPKGIERQTMQRLRKAVTNYGEPFTIDQLAKTTGISRVTLRKYLEYMVECRVLSVEQVYGGIGRPVSRYTVVSL